MGNTCIAARLEGSIIIAIYLSIFLMQTNENRISRLVNTINESIKKLILVWNKKEQWIRQLQFRIFKLEKKKLKKDLRKELKKINKLLRISNKIKKKDFIMNEDCHYDYFWYLTTLKLSLISINLFSFIFISVRSAIAFFQLFSSIN